VLPLSATAEAATALRFPWFFLLNGRGDYESAAANAAKLIAAGCDENVVKVTV
jgi:hypothetical protein